MQAEFIEIRNFKGKKTKALQVVMDKEEKDLFMKGVHEVEDELCDYLAEKIKPSRFGKEYELTIPKKEFPNLLRAFPDYIAIIGTLSEFIGKKRKEQKTRNNQQDIEKIELENEFIERIEARFPGRKMFDDPDMFDNPDNIHYFPTEIEELSAYDGEDYLESQYALDGDFLRIEINPSAEPGHRVRVFCASSNTEWLLNKVSYDDYTKYEQLRRRLSEEGWKENEQHHWSRELHWYEELEPEEVSDMFQEIWYNILEHWGTDEEQPMIKARSVSLDDLDEHLIMLSRAIAYYQQNAGDDSGWRFFYYEDDCTRMSGTLPDNIKTEDEVLEYLNEQFPGREYIPFEHKEKTDYSQPKKK